MRALLDTSVLIAREPPPDDVEAAISVMSITELHFGLLSATDDDDRARRAHRLAAIEAAFDPLPVSVEVARIWGQLTATVIARGGNPRRRQIDLAIAATAIVERVPLLTYCLADLKIISHLVDARPPWPGVAPTTEPAASTDARRRLTDRTTVADGPARARPPLLGNADLAELPWTEHLGGLVHEYRMVS